MWVCACVCACVGARMGACVSGKMWIVELEECRLVLTSVSV